MPNPSFETYTTCPNFQDQLNQAPPWFKPTTGGSSDLFNTCAGSGTFVGVPANDLGNQTPHSGNGYAGFILRPVNNYREYVEVPLTSALLANVTYDVSFYVSLSDASQWAVDKVGAYLSVGPVGPIAGAPTLPFTPQVANPLGNFISNKTAWTLVSRTYVATGGEDHLVIGNFYDNTSTTPTVGHGGFYTGSYYYIDDVSVEVATSCQPPDPACHALLSPSCPNPDLLIPIDGGVPDEFCPPTEPAVPGTALASSAFCTNTVLKDFDAIADNQKICHTITGIPGDIGAAILEIRVKPGADSGVFNDSINLQLTPAGTNFEWSRRIGSDGPNISGLLGVPWTSTSPAFSRCLDLAALPNENGSTTDIIPTLVAAGRLDIHVQDDSAVDYVRLWLAQCPCAPLPDGSACTELACADPNALCRPSKVIDNPTTGQTTVIECGCECFMRRNDVPPFEPLFCTGGTCRATGIPCQLAATPVHGVGIMYDCCGACSQPPRACCLPSYQCVDDDPLCCTQQGGVPAGAGTSCTEPEACCYPDGSDDVQDPVCCTISGGSPQGPGSGTAEVRPAACCFPDGSCSELNPYCCDEVGGTYLGLGIHCLNDTNGDGIDDACCVKGPFDDLTVIDLTTGWDDDANAPIPAGSPDDTWRAVPAASALVLNPTAVFSPSPSPWATLPPSQWISENVNDISAHTDCYEACFCLNAEYENAVLSFSIYADNLARVYLNNPGCGLTATPLITTPNNAFTSPATFFTTANHPKLKVGTNCVQVRVSSPGGPSAFTLLGQLTTDNAQCCCEPEDVHVELTTGQDDGTLAPIQPGFDDDTWNVIWAPTPGPLPRPAVATIEPVNGQGGIQSWFTIPPSRWISTTVYGGANFSFPATEAPDGFYYYESCFCLNGGFKNAVLIGHIRSDDEARVTLNNCFVAATPVCSGTPPCSFNLPNPTAFIMTNPACFQPGRNCVRVDVEQKFGSVTGFTLAGYAAADDAKCCGGGDFAELDREACLTHGDIDCDGDTDLHDSAVLPGCLLGPGEGVSPGCDVVNLEVDADIDLRDASRIQNLFNRL